MPHKKANKVGNRSLKIGDKGEMVVYRTPDGVTTLDVQLKKETVWLTQAQLSELFQKDRSVISKHLRNIFKEGELEEKRNVQKMHIPFSDKPVAVFNLDVIISVGYRVKSKRGTQFRIWATRVLRDHLLYFLVKNHSFVDGNKRIAAALFLWFMEKNDFLYRKDGGKRIADNALVAMTLMIAESDPTEKTAVVNLTINLINRKN